jgi:hypothetical protein
VASLRLTSGSSSEWDPDLENTDNIDWSICITPEKNMRSINKYSTYIGSRIQDSIVGDVELTPSISRVIEKRQKAMKIMVLDGHLVKEELFKKQEEEKVKIWCWSNGNRIIQKYGVIYAGDAHLARNERHSHCYNCSQKRRVLQQNSTEENRDCPLLSSHSKLIEAELWAYGHVWKSDLFFGTMWEGPDYTGARPLGSMHRFGP